MTNNEELYGKHMTGNARSEQQTDNTVKYVALWCKSCKEYIMAAEGTDACRFCGGFIERR